MKKNSNYIYIVCSFLSMVLISVLILFNKDFKITMKKDVINVGENYKDSFTATFRGADVTEFVKIQSNIYDTSLGKYQVTFTYINNKKEYKVVKTVEIKDLDAPVIKLYGGKELVYKVNDSYKELGASAIDNYDGNVSDRIVINSKVDMEKAGTYKVKYNAKDSSGNKGTKTRTVYVLEKTPLEQSLSEFSLKGLFEDTILSENKKAISDKKFNDIFFIGDNDISLLSTYGFVKIANVWYNPKLRLNNVDSTPLIIDGSDTKSNIYENVLANKAKTIVLYFGLSSYNNTSDYIKNYTNLVTNLKDKTDTRIVVMSLNMVSNKKNNKITPKEVNNVNYYLAKMCSDNDIEFLNSAEVLKNQKEDNYLSDGYTLSKSGQKLILDYIKNHI